MAEHNAGAVDRSTPEPEREKENAMTGAEQIAAERQRQIDAEGWTPDHDAHHLGDELAYAAIAYATPQVDRDFRYNAHGELIPHRWPWEQVFWKPAPDDRVRELVKAGALIAAEIDRLQADHFYQRLQEVRRG